MQANRILIVEDEEDIASLLEYHFEKAGFRTDRAANGETAFRIIRNHPPDLVVLDLMLPGMDGLEICKLLRSDKETRKLPILILTAKGDEIDRILGLELGADDYVVKPFSPRELILRVRAILKRVSMETDESDVIMVGNLRVDPGSHRVTINSEEVPLTSTEFNLLLALLRHKGKVLTRDRLLDIVWGYQYEGYARTVDTHIRRLRQKLEDEGSAIETVWGVGYRYKE
ncbi:MAG: response regulator transcription factor [Deltaproteobacteria bacterium]|nr:response regulator transcription factor [Deltaproteobacteria bacterium]